ncbi:von Willebrand factor A domain-containing protein 3A isoform X2 [Brachyhypopomus gauderio]|uniref:von Willebrand factor A domain-containing protein 3A isoform X2 n=1 Tax=Brachyhypopomus gauderio TaxID=698409 RepID=UPI0040432C1F
MSHTGLFFGSLRNTQTVNRSDGVEAQNAGRTSSSKTPSTLKTAPKQRGGVAYSNSSADWLEENSLERRGLTLPRLLSAVSPREDGASVQGEIIAESLSDFEMQLHQLSELYHSRIQWLTEGSRKMFGVVEGCRLGVLIDSSDWTRDAEKLADLKGHLLFLTEEQFCLKKQLYFLSFGTDVTSLWDQPRDVTPQRLCEVQHWLLQLRPSGGCNLLEALEHAWGHARGHAQLHARGHAQLHARGHAQLHARGHAQLHAQLDTLLLILGSRPDQTPDAIVNYVAQSCQQRALPVHAVAYDCRGSHTVDTVKNIAKASGGRYHLYSATLGVVDSSSDLELLWAEIKAARNVLQHIEKMRHAGLTHSPFSNVSEVSAELDGLSLTDVSWEPHGGDEELCIQPAGPLPATSADWLRSHSLEAMKLDLYEELAPNVYTPLEGFVPILGKSVHSTVHKRATVQFTWHDGTVKNVHVDLQSLKNYQRRLLESERLLEDRAEWLSSTASRRIWGTVCEQRVHVLLDTCGMSRPHRLHVRHAVRLLLQEQLPNTRGFNVITFGSDVKSWRDDMAPPTQDNLRDVWRWVQGLHCAGGRNTSTGLRRAVEAGLRGDSALTWGLYLLTTGVPDEDTVEVSTWCHAAGARVHVCLLTAEEGPACSHDDVSETATVLRRLAHDTNGRFHWVTETGIVESDDIFVLVREMRTAADYWQKCCELVDLQLRRSSAGDTVVAQSPECCSPAAGPRARARGPGLPPPRPTLLSLARLSGDVLDSAGTRRSLAWRPNSAKAVIPAACPVAHWKAARSTQSVTHRKVTCSQSVFYLENGALGSVFRTYLQPKSAQRTSGVARLPRREDVCSTKQWLKRFGIRSLGLDLYRLVSGPQCTHRQVLVPTVNRTVSARHCSIFPSVQLNGHLRHLFVSPGELKQYLVRSERVLQRYARRMRWLLSGSRQVFGCVLERAACLVLDLSGSMASGLPGLQRELPALIWEQLHSNGVRFSMVAFSGEVQVWQADLVEATHTRCRDAVKWLGQLNTHGNTSILRALQAACAFGDSVGVYVVSDGKPDCSRHRVLTEAERLAGDEKSITIHTVSLSSLDSTASDFLRSLAHRTGGRFHQTPSHADTDVANQLLAQGFREREGDVLPAFEGDDLRRLKNEMEKLRMFQKQAKAFRFVCFGLVLILYTYVSMAQQ